MGSFLMRSIDKAEKERPSSFWFYYFRLCNIVYILQDSNVIAICIFYLYSIHILDGL